MNLKEIYRYTVAPLATVICNYPALNIDFSSLFQEQHIKTIRSKYFGARGAQDQNLKAHPIQNAIFKSLEADSINKGMFFVENLPSIVMNLALKNKHVPLSIKRFEFHLKLFNYYSLINEVSYETIPIPPAELKSFLNIPKAATIKSSEIDVGCGYFKNQIKLQHNEVKS
ncbi:hypothetical protein INT48_007732 [Thamnidium elegans]|uniref:Uncharacterized protein n=1 Tax=Thamnidium elegans TaxID=101142 RepID=A0A8H7SS15_9FUNG|nr:hypothetical protein INT48_007732 [Thamnidium elegans]